MKFKFYSRFTYYYLVTCLFTIGATTYSQIEYESASQMRQVVSQQEIKSDEQTEDAPQLGLDDYQAVAKTILEVQKAMTDEYEVGDGLTLTAYILKTFAEIGDYELTQEEILSLIDVFEKLTQMQTPVEVKEIIGGIDRLVFSKKGGRLSVVFKTRQPQGFILDVYEANEAPESETLEIEHFEIKDGAQISFETIESHSMRQELIHFIKDDFKLPLLPSKWFSMLNQIHPGVQNPLDLYLQQKRNALPLKLSMSGFILRIETSTLFKTIDFEIQEAFTTPGLVMTREKVDTQHGDELIESRPLPSFHLWMQEKILKVKASVTD